MPGGQQVKTEKVNLRTWCVALQEFNHYNAHPQPAAAEMPGCFKKIAIIQKLVNAFMFVAKKSQFCSEGVSCSSQLFSSLMVNVVKKKQDRM
jgi:hypothetical protein